MHTFYKAPEHINKFGSMKDIVLNHGWNVVLGIFTHSAASMHDGKGQ